MTNIINYENLFKVFQNWNDGISNYIGVIFTNIYKCIPKCYYVEYTKTNKLVIDHFINRRNTDDNDLDEYDDYICETHMIDDRKTLHNFNNLNNVFEIVQYTPYEYIILGKQIPFLTYICTSESEKSLSKYHIIYTENTYDLDDLKELISNMYISDKRAKETEFGIAAVGDGGTIYTTYYDFHHIDVNIEDNYNDDIHFDRMVNILNNDDKASLMLFYGDPGTGKSTLIKYFIEKLQNKHFIFMDGTLLANVQQDRLMAYFLENKDSVFIFEDCEKILVSREHNYNPTMSILLNLTDGIISDVLNIKIICTFNTSLNNIDKALLRKGRLTLKYEFKKLAKDKVKKLISKEEIKQDMSLADIYNYKEENDYSKKQTSTIGFR